MRIVLASDEKSLRSSLSMLIDAQADLELVGDVGDVVQLVAKSKLRHPELIVLDWDALGNQIEMLFKLFAAADEVAPDVIALSVHEEARSEILASGVSEFVDKGEPPMGLLEAIRRFDAKKEKE